MLALNKSPLMRKDLSEAVVPSRVCRPKGEAPCIVLWEQHLGEHHEGILLYSTKPFEGEEAFQICVGQMNKPNENYWETIQTADQKTLEVLNGLGSATFLVGKIACAIANLPTSQKTKT